MTNEKCQVKGMHRGKEKRGWKKREKEEEKKERRKKKRRKQEKDGEKNVFLPQVCSGLFFRQEPTGVKGNGIASFSFPPFTIFY